MTTIDPTEQQGEPDINCIEPGVVCDNCGADVFADEHAVHPNSCRSCWLYWRAIDRGVDEERDNE